jgi:hypothetical protein
MKAAVSSYCSPPFVSRLAPTHLGWDTQRQFTRRSRDPGVETPTVTVLVECLVLKKASTMSIFEDLTD